MMKTAYLTIDDGPSKDAREKVDFLLSKSIPAVWFCRGDFLEKRSESVAYLVKKGFVIGNHSYSHPHFSCLNLEQCFDEIRKTDVIIEEIYAREHARRSAKFFRFPYGDKGSGKTEKDALQTFLRKLGYTQPKFSGITYEYCMKEGFLDDADWHWTYDVMEWAVFRKEHPFGIDSLEKVFARMEEDVPEEGRGLNYPGSEDIILIHDQSESVDLFRPIIEHLLAKGIVFRLPPPK